MLRARIPRRNGKRSEIRAVYTQWSSACSAVVGPSYSSAKHRIGRKSHNAIQILSSAVMSVPPSMCPSFDAHGHSRRVPTTRLPQKPRSSFARINGSIFQGGSVLWHGGLLVTLSYPRKQDFCCCSLALNNSKSCRASDHALQRESCVEDWWGQAA